VKINVDYVQLENGNVLLKNVLDPETKELIEIELRDLQYEEIQILQNAQKTNANVIDETYKLLACIIVKWGNDSGITTLELRSKGFKIYRLLEGALQEFFLPEFEFKAN
jgi:hypothetical protein